jgi:hypothetical protein
VDVKGPCDWIGQGTGSPTKSAAYCRSSSLCPAASSSGCAFQYWVMASCCSSNHSPCQFNQVAPGRRSSKPETGDGCMHGTERHMGCCERMLQGGPYLPRCLQHLCR